MKSSVCPVALALTTLFQVSATNAAGTPIDSCREIDQPGSYTLVANLNANGNCLVVKSHFVTIDFDGFAMTGDGTGSGVIVPARQLVRGLVVRNGAIQKFKKALSIFRSKSGTIEEMQIKSISVQAIEAGNGTIIVDNVVALNGGSGINAGLYVVIERNIVWGSGGTGISFDGGIAKDNVASYNGRIGIIGRGIISGNTVEQNGDIGIVVLDGSNVYGNTARLNEVGLRANCPSNIFDNTFTDNSGGDLRIRDRTCRHRNNVPPVVIVE